MKKKYKEFIEELASDIFAICHDDKMAKEIAFALGGKYTKKPNRTHLITYKGETKSLAEWARELGISFGCLTMRLGRLSVEEAFTLSEKKKSGRAIEQYDVNGNFIKRWDSIKEAADALYVRPQSIQPCLKKGKGTSAGYVWKYATGGTV